MIYTARQARHAFRRVSRIESKIKKKPVGNTHFSLSSIKMKYNIYCLKSTRFEVERNESRMHSLDIMLRARLYSALNFMCECDGYMVSRRINNDIK